MWISRVRVTGGHLANFDATLAPGLNVVIGPRGAGKTTLLELLRYALGINRAVVEADASSLRRVKEMLGDGEVILDLAVGEESTRIVVDAEGAGIRVELASLGLMLGQNELEAIADSPASRLALIDLRAGVQSSVGDVDSVPSTTIRMAAIRSRQSELSEQLRQRPLLTSDLDNALGEEARLMNRATIELTEQRAALSEIETRTLGLQQSANRAKRISDNVNDAHGNFLSGTLPLRRLARSQVSAELPITVGESLERAANLADLAQQAMREAATSALESMSKFEDAVTNLRAEAAPLRAELDAAERGLGEVTARTRNLRVQLARLAEHEAELSRLAGEYADLSAARTAAFARTESRQEADFEARERVATQLSAQLSGSIVVSVEHLADFSEYRRVLTEVLRGSNLQFRSIADAIARTTLPTQLVQLIEDRDAETLASLSGLQIDRISRALEFLSDVNSLVKIALCALEDRVDFLLRDGPNLKSVEQLSTGQKCAVTLPILLSEHSRALLLDQPEDHLDNAYLVENIVTALVDRSNANTQTIVATHNANIPVLGAAEKVLALQSDGSRGFLTTAGPYDSDPVVDQITSLMEGGEAAFRRRKNFYAAHGQRI